MKKTTKKEAFFNILLRYLREKNLTVKTINSTYISVTSGLLGGLTFIADKCRVKVFKQLTNHDFKKVNISIDISVNYSIETLLYKLFRFEFINETAYTKLIANHA
nr:hypothetical protein [Pedobacter sp. ASV2]